MILAYLFALDPTPEQEQAFRSHCGAQRVAYNWALAQVRANWAQRAAEQTYGLTDDQLTPWINTSAYSLRKLWNDTKHDVAPWWAENSKEAYASGCANLATALGNRKAGRTRMPRFKSKHRARLTCRFTTGMFGLGADRRHIRLPVIGAVRTAESTRKLARKVEAGTTRIRSVTLSYQRGRWHVSFSVEVDDAEPAPRDGGRVLGVDLGITDLAVLSTGQRVPNARRLDAALRDLRRAQRTCSRRRGPDRRTRTEPSGRWRKARAHADRIHTRVANLRRNDTHQLTTRLVAEFDTIAIEDLHVAGMIRNRSLARHIAGASWAEIRRQFTYKAERTGGSPPARPARDAAQRKPSWPCPSGPTCARRAASSSIGTSTLHGTWPLWRPTPASCAGSCPLEAMSDRPCKHARQSHRHGKSRQRLNATAVRRWLDEHVLTRFIERCRGVAGGAVSA